MIKRMEFVSMKHVSEQYLIDFSSRTNDRCAKLAALRELQLGISPGRLNGVVELLQRLTVLARYLPEELSESYTVEAQVSAIGSRIHARHSVSEKTVRNWTLTAVELGCLAVDYRSQKFGGRSWNVYHVNFARVLELLVAGNGRKWPVTVTAPRAESISDPGAETVTDPNSVLNKSYQSTALEQQQLEMLSMGVAMQLASRERPARVAVDSYDRLVDEYNALEVHGAAELLSRAAQRVGWEYLERLLRFYQSRNGAWGPGALRCRVQAANPGLPVEKGWPPPRTKPLATPELEPVTQRRVDEKLEAGLRHTRMVKLLKLKLGRYPEDHEVEEALREGAIS
jgi:hypothetical protein